MTSELTMSTWTVTYNDYAAISGSNVAPATVEIDAAYYGTAGHLVEFKNSDHQVVFAVHSGIVTTIRRGAAAEQQTVEA